MRQFFVKYLMSLLLVAVLMALISSLTGVGARGVQWLQSQDTIPLRRESNTKSEQRQVSSATEQKPLERSTAPRRTQSQRATSAQRRVAEPASRPALDSSVRPVLDSTEQAALDSTNLPESQPSV
ncbi:MAG: hypothetical protein J6U69_03375, partial [Alistipes sp.]|nr:hypothetical protein [Alistipes sp.]